MSEGPLGTIPQINIDVFCENADAAQVIKESAADRRMSRASIRVLMGGIPRALTAYEHDTTPEVVVVEVQGNRDNILSQIEDLADVCDINTQVIILGRVNDVVLYRELIRRGVRDYLAAPFDVYSIIRSISELFGAEGNKPIGKAYSCMGVRGGAGCSSIVQNIGMALAGAFDTATVLVDFDLAFGTLALNFNEDSQQNILEVIFDPTRVDNVLLERLLLPYNKKLSLLCAPYATTRTYDIPERAADAIIDNLRTMVPVTILDIPNGWSSWQSHSLMSADEIILVCNPDLASLRSTRQLLDLFQRERPNDQPPKVILNQVGMPKRDLEEIDPGEFEAGLNTKLLGTVSFDANAFAASANNGKPLVETDPDNPVSKEIIRIAGELIGRRIEEPARKSPLDFLSKFTKR
ncbi:MAG: AAA family ATPase [Methylobacteriaceae bacterium]|jgi:pilus assembly protein CpaE|nr:AAA family ATPase [Methylobacteriaceae bacterium]